MNDMINMIKNRRSIRKYKATPIANAEIQAIAETAIYAPSAMNQQKWHFTVVQNKETLDKMNNTIRENILNSGVEFLMERAKDPGFNVFHHAPAIIMITADPEAGFTEVDCGAAMENITLAAASLNIGSCCIGMSEFLFKSENADETRKELGIPQRYKHIITVTLGYKDMENPPAPPKNKEAINYIK